MRPKRMIVAAVAAVFIAAGYAGAESPAAVKARIYPQLRDQRCSSMTLDKCTCADSRVMKAYVDALIDTGTKDADILFFAGKRFSPMAIVDDAARAAVEKRLIGMAGEQTPLIAVDALQYDFGKVKKGAGTVAHRFKVKNAGAAPLIIHKLKVSCTCTTATLYAGKSKQALMGTKGPKPAAGIALAPAESAELEVVLDLADRVMTTGSVVRNITLTTNDPVYPDTTIVVRANVEK